jgi:hypothetical protein
VSAALLVVTTALAGCRASGEVQKTATPVTLPR